MNLRIVKVAAVVGALLFAAPVSAEAQPVKAPRVGFLGLGSDEASPFFEALRQGLRERGWVEGQNVAFEDRSAVDHYNRLPDSAAELIRLKVDVIVTRGTGTTQAARKATGTIPIVMVAGNDPARQRLPAIFPDRDYVDAGGLMSYDADSKDLFRRAATYVDRILKGAKPGDLPIEQPITFELVINKKAARALGLTIPPALLLRAHQVIE